MQGVVGGGAGPGGGAKGREEKMPFKQAGLYIIENVVRYLTAFYFYDVFFFSPRMAAFTDSI